LKFLAAVLFLFLISYAHSALAQNSEDVHATGSNLLRVGDGSTTDPLGNMLDKRYFEEIANARLFFQNFSLGLRYEMDDPSEVGRSFQGIRRRWITYRKDQLDIQAGDVSALFGRGLAINLFESRPLNYDSWLDGAFAKSEYKIPKDWLDIGASVGIQGVGGKEDFYPIDTTQPVMHISAQSVNSEFGFFKKQLLLGATFVQAFTGTAVPGRNNTTLPTSRMVDQPDFYLDLNSGEFEAFAEWTENRTQVTQFLGSFVDTTHTGHAVYGSLSYSNAIIGVTAEYKNYSYFIHNPTDEYINVFSKLPIASPPEVYKDMTYTSITRTTHSVNFDDEVGYEVEANITAIPRVTINLNAAASSTHDKWSGAGVAVDSTSIFPKLHDQGFYPFWETFAEVEWDFDPANDLNYAKVAFHRRSDVIVYNAFDPSATDYRWTTTIAGKLQYETTPTQSFLGILEHQWEYDASLTTPDKMRLNELITLQYSFNPIITFGGILDLDIQYENMPFHLENNWPQGFISLRLGGSHTLLMSYGSERGGLNCTGGICRVVPPFKGIRLTLTSQI
jgi:hypothetical protein